MEEDLYKTDFTADRLIFTLPTGSESTFDVNARIRYKANDAPATVTVKDGFVEIKFKEPQRAITPGQPVVFYRDDEMIGGGVIKTALGNTVNKQDIKLIGV